MADGLADPPPWVTSLSAALQVRGYLVCDERRNAISLKRDKYLVIEISRDGAVEPPPAWQIVLIPGDYGRPLLPSVTVPALREQLREWPLRIHLPAELLDESTDDAQWLIENLDLVYGLEAVR